MNRNWWLPLLIVLVVGAAGATLIGVQTYRDAPPIADFVEPSGAIVASRAEILRGQATFQRYALMDYGSMFGDGANRGPDFTAEALHVMTVAMRDWHRDRLAATGAGDRALAIAGIDELVRHELRRNGYDRARRRIVVGEAQAYAFGVLERHWLAFFTSGASDAFQPRGYLGDTAAIAALSKFFAWGAWVCAAERPGERYSYTHNWPFDAQAGNTPTPEVNLWSVLGALALMATLGAVLYVRGRGERPQPLAREESLPSLLSDVKVAATRPTPTQRATYKFFVVAALLFGLQVLFGILTVHDFVGLTRVFGVELRDTLPITITRGWHLQLALMWISTCWFAASIFLLPVFSGAEPRGQRALVNALFTLLAVVVAGSLVGTILGPAGVLGEHWNTLGNQGWEFLEMGRLWQGALYASFMLWAFIVWRGARPALQRRQYWTLPHWLVYTTLAINVLFLSGFVWTPETNFVIAEFWRWMVIHMWVEAFFEVFTTIIVAYFMVSMGLITQKAAVRTVYFATLLFLGSGLLGISHNFYWNAKPVFTMAIGSVFSTLQVVPLLLLTIDAWRMRAMPAAAARREAARSGVRPAFGQSEALLFLLGVNFWNFVGAGVFGFIINLPIVNYYEHGTYLTVNHGHSALMGVYGNLSIAAMLFCARFLVRPERWSARLLRSSFWAINLGLGLMVVLDLFPVGVHHLMTVLERGLWYARSLEYVEGETFQTFTWMRIVGGALFTLGGVVPIAWFLASRAGSLKRAEPSARHNGVIALEEPDLETASTN
jgi:nitric oxide reductase subunit B